MFVATGSVSREFVLNKKGKTMSAEQISAWIKTLAPKIGADLIAESPDNFVLAFLGAIHCKIRYSTPDDRLYFFAPLEIPGLDSATIDPNLLLEANHLAVGLGGMAFYRAPETGDIILAQSFSMRFLDAKEFFMVLKGFLFSARALWEFVIQAMENLNNGDSFLSDEDCFKKTAAWQRANC